MPEITFTLNGTTVVVTDDGCSLLEALRDRLGVRSTKDGCSPQGQCGCCTVWVDGAPRVACVTPVARVRDRAVTTLEGLVPETAQAWGDSLCETGGSQCGFCTPGIIMRLEAQRSKNDGGLSAAEVDQAMLAHLCRCTGWQTIREAASLVVSGERRDPWRQRSREGAERRAAIEGGASQQVGAGVALGRAGFADDTAPADALVAVRSHTGEWVVGETLSEARRRAGKVQGRRTTAPMSWPVDVPEGAWNRVLQTTWVEPAYLEPDASWCEPGGEPVSASSNGGAFGAKQHSEVLRVARTLADTHGRAVRVLYAREDVVRLGPKRPPMAIGLRSDGSGVVRVARTPGAATLLASFAPQLDVQEVTVVGPPTSVDLRAACWAEVAVTLASLGPVDEVRAPEGGWASAELNADGSVRVAVRAGEVLDETVLRSYCIGAAHMALGWVRNEAVSVDAEGEVHDLTMRSFGVLRAVDTPPIEIDVLDVFGPPVAASGAVFAAVAAATWRAAGFPDRWPLTRHG